MKMAMYIFSGILLLLVVLALTGKKSVHDEININAPAEKVWQTLMRMDTYQWNPVMQLIEGQVKAGNKVKYHFTEEEGKSYEVGTVVEQVIPYKLLNQKGGIPWTLTFNHKYILEAEGNTCKMIIHEDYRGVGVHFWDSTPVEQAYKRLNEALKKEVENN